MKIILAGFFILLAALPAAAQDDADFRLVTLSSHSFVAERVGTLTSVRCAKKDASEDCKWLEAMDPQPQVDWEALGAKAKASQMFADQYGGPWIITTAKGHEPRVAADFAGYKVSVSGSKVLSADVLKHHEEWDQVRKELGLPEPGEKKKHKLTDLLH
jgi:hypothetical protein